MRLLLILLAIIIIGLLVFKKYISDHVGKYINKNISSQYTCKDNDIYYIPMGNWFELGLRKIAPADCQSFRVLSSSLAKDNKHVYFNGEIILTADHNTIEFLFGEYFRDKSQLYYRSEVIAQLKPDDHISPIQNDFEHHYLRLNRKIRPNSKIYFLDKPIDVSFVDQFKMLTHNYATDGSNVFYKKKIISPIEINNYFFKHIPDITNENKLDNYHYNLSLFLMDSKRVFWRGNEIKQADPESFHLVNYKRGFYADNSSIFVLSKFAVSDSNGIEKISGANPKYFTIINDDYERDNNFLYFQAKKIPHSDPDSYTKINFFFSKDKNNLYWNGYIVLNRYADEVNDLSKKIFKVFFYDKYSVKIFLANEYQDINKNFQTDGKVVFHRQNLIPDADLGSFTAIDNYYSKDSKHVFYASETVMGADLESFESIDLDFAKDNKHAYWKNLQLLNIDPGQFKPEAESYGEQLSPTTARYIPNRDQ